jgi:exodeoxyribonuclease VII large subunit
MEEYKVLSLSEVTRNIQEALADRFSSAFWVKAEMNKLNLYPQSGHCYPDLVEKANGKIIAEMRANIWKDDFLRINSNFLRVLREPLKDGIGILFSAKVNFHPVYGISLRIIDIDPSYSLGELEKEKQQTIERLIKEGIFSLNKSQTLALLPKRIAVISADTSKGYADFRNVIDDNPWGYRFFHMLFPAYLQGENAVESIISQLNRIERVKNHFDAVAIIRGGGGDIGLSSYNNYQLSRAIALFPLPVLTGIGHSTNETVAEMVSYKNAITPTELADFLIQKFHNFAVPVQKAKETIIQAWTGTIREEKGRLLNVVRFCRSVTTSRLIKAGSDINAGMRTLWIQSLDFLRMKKEREIGQNIRNLGQYSVSVISGVNQGLDITKMNFSGKLSNYLLGEMKTLENMERSVTLLDPARVLDRGYSITMSGGKVLKTIDEIEEGSVMKTILKDGEITSIAGSKQKNVKI